MIVCYAVCRGMNPNVMFSSKGDSDGSIQESP